MKQAIILILLFAVGALADGGFGKSRRLQQLCHPQRGGGITSPGIGGFYTHPEIDGAKVDFCLRKNVGCGKQAADEFCKTKGLAFSDSYVAWTFAGSACSKTVHIGNKRSCTGSDCAGFRVISCAEEAPAPAKTEPSSQELTKETPIEPASPPETVGEETPVDSDDEPKQPISQDIDLEGSEAPTEPEGFDETAPGADTEKSLLSPDSADGSGEGSEEDTVVKKTPESPASSQTPAKKEPASDSPADKSEENPASQESDDGKKDTIAENVQPSATPLAPGPNESPSDADANAPPSDADANAPPSDAEANAAPSDADTKATPSAADTNATPSDADTNEPEDGVVIDHPDLGNVVLPGQEGSATSGNPAQPPTKDSDANQAKPPSGSSNDQDALFCQERGSQSATAAARSGCGSVISKCATDDAITKSQSNLGGVAGRRLFQSLVDSASCKKLFADECQAAAFDNATGICATLMGSGPNPGEERPGCATAEEAREIFKSVVKDSCAIFLAGAFP